MQAVSLPSVVPGLALTVPDINTVNMSANNSHQSYQVSLGNILSVI